MGKDGENDSSNPNRFFANDAAAYALHYFENDYIAKAKADGSYNAQDFFLMQIDAASYLNTQAPNLYNGNIRAMVTTVRSDNASGNNPVASLTAYQYDQLNRIKQMKMYRDANLSTNAWGNGASYSGAFEEHYVYDHNGNILQQKRNGNATTIAMDNLRYYYYKQDGTIFDPLVTATPSNATNKLAYVTDAVGAGNYTADIDNQSSGNYTYDAIGQLTSDTQEEIASIEWTVSGKVSKVLRNNGSSKKDLEFIYDPMGKRIAKIVKPQGSSNTSQWKYTFYVLDASGNQMATYTKEEEEYFFLEDQTIFGSSREGIINRNLALDTAVLPSTVIANHIGDKQYQTSNHLGNVLSTFADALIPDNNASGNTITNFKPVILSVSSYSSFGAPLEDPNTNWSNENYRYGFQNQEKDDEIKGEGNSINFTYRMHDPRLGRFFAVDPLAKKYPHNSTYAFSENSVISFIELEGKEKYSVHVYSFAPFDYFGTWLDAYCFVGDGNNRCYGQQVYPYSAKKEGFRIGAKVDVDLNAKKVIDKNKYGSVSKHECSGATAYSDAFWSQSPFLNSDNSLSFGIYGNDDAMMGGACPSIDVKVDLKLNYNKNAKTLQVSGVVMGDGFPASETYIVDESGTRLFVGVSGTFNDSPWSLWGGPTTVQSFFNFTVNTDTCGNFLSVQRADGKTFTISEWNAQFTNMDPQSTNSSSATSSGVTDKGYISTGESSGSQPTCGNPDSPICFIAGTKISMADGSFKDIEKVKVGDSILTYNFKSSLLEKQIVLKIDSPIHETLVKVTLVNGIDTIKNTNTHDHPYFVIGKGWCSFNPNLTEERYGLKCQKIEINDICIYSDGKTIHYYRIISLEQVIQRQTTYNLTDVSNNHNYFANGILVHNKALE